MVCGAAQALHHYYPQEDIQLYTNPDYSSIIDRCPFVKMSHKLHNYSIDLSPAKFGLAPIHQIDAYLEDFGLYGVPDDLKSIVLNDDPEPGPRYKSDKTIVIHAPITDPNRTYPHWQAVVDTLVSKGYSIVQIGKTGYGKANQLLLRTVDFSNRLSLEGTLGLIRDCALFISTDSGPIQLAGATDTPILGIYSVVDGLRRIPYRKNAKSRIIQASCSLESCYDYMKDQDIWTKNKLDTLGETFSQWCPAKTDYSCLYDLEPEVICKAAQELIEE